MNKFWATTSLLVSAYSFKEFFPQSSLMNAVERQLLFFGQSTQAEAMGNISAASQNSCWYDSTACLLLWLVFLLINHLFFHFDICVYLESCKHINQNNKFLAVGIYPQGSIRQIAIPGLSPLRLEHQHES